MFANDTNIYSESSNLLHLQKTMNKHLRYVKKWLDADKLALNLDKTNFVFFHSPQVSTTELIRLKLGKKQIHQEKYVKFLGVLLDEHLNWKYHITELSRKLARVSGVFFKIKYFLPIDVLKSLYYAMFFSILQYGIAVWELTYPTYLQPFFILQKRILKAMTYSFLLDHSNPLFRDLELLKLSDIRSLQLLSFV